MKRATSKNFGASPPPAAGTRQTFCRNWKVKGGAGTTAATHLKASGANYSPSGHTGLISILPNFAMGCLDATSMASSRSVHLMMS